jgi:trehalose 6-phosphate phosphatase
MGLTRLEHPPALDTGRVALFLDLDGTIAEIAPQPGDVGPLAPRTALLRSLGERLDGRLAVLTGRTLEEADRILEGAVRATAAVHGLVRRDASGKIEAATPSPGIAAARAALRSLADARPGLVLEEKQLSLALHYRHAAEAVDGVLDATRRIAQANGLALQAGAMVSELRTPGPHKGDALRSLMERPPFGGFTPVMLGDDLTDEAAFAAAADLGGWGILVGAPRPTAARYGLEDVAAVMAWLLEGLR